MSHPHNSSKRVHVYIDETGDRGRSSASSPIFGMAAVIIEQSDTSVLRQALLDLRKDFRVPNGKVLSWKEYVKTHDRRRQAARRLAAVQGIRVCYVYVDKRALRPTAYGGSVEVMYNYVAGKMLKSALWAARSAFGTDGQVWIRYGHVRRHNHQTTESYLRQQILPDPRVPSAMLAGLNWVSADKYVESQAADIFGGFLKAALWPGGEFSMVEPSYLLKVWSLIHNTHVCAVPLGLMSMPESNLVTKEAWFPCVQCPKSGA